MTSAQITSQQRLVAGVATPRSRRDFRRIARWWELEAMRGYESAPQSRAYAANMRWLVELMDNGAKVVGHRFDELAKEQGRR